jgi:hypothetical protein
MSPLAGRFLGRDPIGYSLLSLYLYTNSNPQNNIDPSGHMPQAIGGALAGCGISGASSALGSALVNFPNIGNFGGYCCSVGCDAFGGCLSGAIFGAFPSFITGCVGGALGSAVASLCERACKGEPLNGCELYGLAFNVVLGCFSGYAAEYSTAKIEALMIAIGLNVAAWTELCDQAGGMPGGPQLGGPVCCTFSSWSTIWSQTVQSNFGETPADACQRAGDGWLWNYNVVASRGGGCS